MPKLSSENSHSLGGDNKRDRLLAEALTGDIEFVVKTTAGASATAVTQDPTSSIWSRTVLITVENAAEEVHDWLNVDITSGVSIADTSTAGTASIPSTTLSIVEGRGSVVVSGDAAAWLNSETDVLTVTAYTGFAGQTAASVTSTQTTTTP